MVFLDGHGRQVSSRQEYVASSDPARENSMLPYLRECKEIGKAELAGGSVNAYPNSIRAPKSFYASL